MHAGRLPTLSHERKKECSKLEEKAPHMHTLHHLCTQKKTHVCIDDDMVSIWGGEKNGTNLVKHKGKGNKGKQKELLLLCTKWESLEVF